MIWYENWRRDNQIKQIKSRDNLESARRIADVWRAALRHPQCAANVLNEIESLLVIDARLAWGDMTRVDFNRALKTVIVSNPYRDGKVL